MKALRRISDAYHAVTGRGTPYNAVEHFTAENAQNKLKEEKKRGRSASDFPNLRQKFRVHEDIKTLENAISLAESTNYNREDIHRIYRQHVEEDLHVTSQWNNRKIKTKKRDFGIFPKGDATAEVNDELTALLKKKWVFDFMDAALDSLAWGFSLVELFNWDKEKRSFEKWRNPNGKIADPVEVIDRDYVKPETGQIVEQTGLLKGLDFHDPKFRNQLVFIGGKANGFFFKLAKMILFKNNAIANWSEWIEVFGIDALVIKSSVKGTERKALLKALKAFSTSRTAVIEDDEEIQTVGTNKTDAYKVFEMLAKYVDSGSSKVIHGQDVISNNTGQVVGTVGENVANDYADADARFLTDLFNNELIPLLIRAEYIPELEGHEFRFTQKMSTKEMKERAEVDKLVADMGFAHDPDLINERYGVNVETRSIAGIASVANKLKEMYPDLKTKLN